MTHNLEELEALAVQSKTDKQMGQNAYLALYLEYFERQGIKRDAPLRILEIGTNKGSSLRMWAEYFPNAYVVGIDITRMYEVEEILNHESIATYELDASKPDQLDKMLAQEIYCNQGRDDLFDIIIDDGSHDQAEQQITWGYLFHYVKPGGLYVIEDIITGEPWWDGRLYNKKKVIATRIIVQELEQGVAIDKVQVIPEDEWDYIMKAHSYCEYRESPAVIFDTHHPQLAFIGKK